MNINPTKLLVQDIEEQESVTKGGIFVPGTAKVKSMRGRVIITGGGTDYVKIVHEVGSTVVFNPSAGTKFTYEDKEYRLIDVSEVLMSIWPSV